MSAMMMTSQLAIPTARRFQTASVFLLQQAEMNHAVREVRAAVKERTLTLMAAAQTATARLLAAAALKAAEEETAVPSKPAYLIRSSV